MTSVLIRQEETQRQRRTWGRRPRDNKGRDWSDGCVWKRRTTRTAGKHQNLEEARRILPYRFQRPHSPADTLISDFQARSIHFCVLSHPVLGTL